MTQKVKNHPFRGFLTYLPENQVGLFKFNFSAYFCESSLEGFSFSLVNAFLDGGGSAVDEFLSLFKAKTSLLFHELNDFKFFSACGLENYIESSFFFSSGSTCSGTGSNSYGSSSGFDAIFFLEDLGKFVYFLNGEVNKLFSKSFEISPFCINLVD